MIITIDGPSGAGKSTIAKGVAKKLNFKYLDTGAMYRAITLFLIENNINISNEEEVEKFIYSNRGQDKFKLEFKDSKVIMNSKDISAAIRNQHITNSVSEVSSYEIIRKLLVDKQREIAINRNIILDGRDTGSVVFPKADLKIYLTASVDERAKRRYMQDKSISFSEVLNSIKTRDYKDMHRDISPLIIPDKAILIDSTNMSIDETIDKIVFLAKDDRYVL